MAKIVKLAEILPPDIVFELPGGARYTFPSDPPLGLFLKIASLFERAEGAPDEEGVGLETLAELDAEILGLLRMRDPSIEQSPFGVLGVQHVVARLLAIYNPDADVEEGTDADPLKAPRPRSKRSSGSGRSSSSSDSRTTTGER